MIAALSSINLSASSNTKNRIMDKSNVPLRTKSINFPGEAVTISTPLPICFTKVLVSAPPTTNAVSSLGEGRYLVKELRTSWVCWAKSLVGSNISAKGKRLIEEVEEG